MRLLTLLICIALLSPLSARAEKTQENRFASVYYKKDKIGQVHLTTVRNEKGEVEELKANASLSFLGLQIYGFDQNLHEYWSGGELQKMEGRTDDNGVLHEITLLRKKNEYDAMYNLTNITLPLAAFPTSPWHYEITQNKLLFNIVDFELLKVDIKQSPDVVHIGNTDIPATRFDFTGDWKAALWFDAGKQFVKGQYDVAGRQVTVVLDPREVP